MTYRLETKATMKLYNSKKYWIDREVVKDMEIEADSVKQALEIWRGKCSSLYGVDVSDNALKRKEEMWQDIKDGDRIHSRQVGWVITGKTMFQDDDNGYTEHYIDLWVEIKKVSYIDFETEVA